MRNTVPIKQNFTNANDLTFIILAAGKGRRTSSYGNKSNTRVQGTSLNPTNLINFQIQTIRNKFPNVYDIIVVVGFDADRIIRTIPNGVRIIENERYDETNITRSISMGLRAAKSENVFLINGDILFDENTFNNFTRNTGTIIDMYGRMDDQKVNVIVENYLAVNFSYGLTELDNRWGQISYMQGKELEILRKIVSTRDFDHWSAFEILNKIISKGGKIQAVFADEACLLKEINTIKDIKQIKKEGVENLYEDTFDR